MVQHFFLNYFRSGYLSSLRKASRPRYYKLCFPSKCDFNKKCTRYNVTMNGLTFPQWRPTHHIINVATATNRKQVNNINIHAKYNILHDLVFSIGFPFTILIIITKKKPLITFFTRTSHCCQKKSYPPGQCKKSFRSTLQKLIVLSFSCHFALGGKTKKGARY